MSHYEQKEIPSGSGNFYWYLRTVEGGRQKSQYVGKKLPHTVESNREKYEADRNIEVNRRKIERKIAELSAQLAQLK
jgi:hypothetical protein